MWPSGPPNRVSLVRWKSLIAYFLEQGIVSVVATVESDTAVEVGVIGIDSVVGIPILLGTGTAPGRTFVQIAQGGKINSSVRASFASTCRNMYRPCWNNSLRVSSFGKIRSTGEPPAFTTQSLPMHKSMPRAPSDSFRPSDDKRKPLGPRMPQEVNSAAADRVKVVEK